MRTCNMTPPNEKISLCSLGRVGDPSSRSSTGRSGAMFPLSVDVQEAWEAPITSEYIKERPKSEIHRRGWDIRTTEVTLNDTVGVNIRAARYSRRRATLRTSYQVDAVTFGGASLEVQISRWKGSSGTAEVDETIALHNFVVVCTIRQNCHLRALCWKGNYCIIALAQQIRCTYVRP